MKFARYLEEQQQPEWSKAYIRYRPLKRLIKLVDARRSARMALLKAQLPPTPPSAFSRTFPQFSSVDHRSERDRSASVQESSGPPYHIARTLWSDSAPVTQPDSDHSPERQPPPDQAHTPIPTPPAPAPAPDSASSNTPNSLPDLEAQAPHEPSHQHTEPDAGATESHPRRVKIVAPDVSATQDEKAAGSPHAKQPDELPSVTLPPQLRIDPQATIIPPYCEFESKGTSEGSSHIGEPSELTENWSGANQKQTWSTDQTTAGPSTDQPASESGPSTNAATQALLNLVTSSFDVEERKIFAVLDTEMERMLSFYEERRNQTSARFERIAIQLKELAEHRMRYRAARQPGTGVLPLRTGTGLLPLRTGGHGSAHTSGLNVASRAQGIRPSAPLSRLRRNSHSDGHAQPTPQNPSPPSPRSSEEEVEDPGYERRAQAMKAIPSVLPNTAHITLSPANVAATAGEFDPERYKSARRAVKMAMLELYRELHILQSFQFLCRVGMVKILKKASKTWGVPVSEPYLQARVNHTALVTDDSVTRLVKATEELYAAFYEHGDKKRALDRLRSMTGGTALVPSAHHFSAFKAGMFAGVAVCSTCAGIVQVMRDDTPDRIPDWQALLRVYGAFMIFSVFGILYGLNLMVWHQWRVNAPFIFQFDLRSTLHPMQYFPLPCLLTMLLAIFFWISFLDPFPRAIAPTTWPLVWVVVSVVLLINPLPIFNPRSREWFVRTFLRLLTGGMLPGNQWSIQFKDFFLGDEFNSLQFSVSTLWVFGCSYNEHWEPGSCDFNHTWWRAGLMAFFPFLRLTQCFRRWFDSKRKDHIHLINAGKYAMGVTQAFIYVYWRSRDSPLSGGTAGVMATISTIYSLYAASWDILMDWSLLQPHSKPYPFLRDTLWFSSVWYLYYVAIITNVYIRFAWSIYFYRGPASQLLRGYIVGLLEMFRRWQWNFIRVENEHLGNSDSYRVVRDMPLPYPTRIGQSGSAGYEEEDEDEEDQELQPAPVNRGYAASISTIASRLTRRSRSTNPSAHPTAHSENSHTLHRTPLASHPPEPQRGRTPFLLWPRRHRPQESPAQADLGFTGDAARSDSILEQPR